MLESPRGRTPQSSLKLKIAATPEYQVADYHPKRGLKQFFCPSRIRDRYSIPLIMHSLPILDQNLISPIDSKSENSIV